MKCIKHSLGDYDEIRILPLADLHLGDINCDFTRVQAWIREIRESENTFAVLNGDLMDSAIKSSIGDVYGANLQPMEQLKQCVAIFEPIRDKILAVLPGNHEARIYRSDGLDLTEIMCSQLGIAERYAPASAMLFVRFGRDRLPGHHGRKVLYTIYCVHGTGGGKKEGAKLQRVVDLAAIADADIYLHSHTHMPIVSKMSYFRTDLNNSSVQKVDKLFVNTGSALEWGGYAEVQSYKPASNDTPVIVLSGHRRSMKAIL